jgi:hypothetical protein
MCLGQSSFLVLPKYEVKRPAVGKQVIIGHVIQLQYGTKGGETKTSLRLVISVILLLGIRNKWTSSIIRNSSFVEDTSSVCSKVSGARHEVGICSSADDAILHKEESS